MKRLKAVYWPEFDGTGFIGLKLTEQALLA
jgi:hypothetical protein